MTSNEGGLIPEEYQFLYARDRTETTGQVWLGLTVGCAVCHDHKYDPITQKDFYSLSAFFNNITMKAMDGNVKDTPPVIVVPEPADRARWQQLAAEIPAADQSLATRKKTAHVDFTNWLTQTDFSKITNGWPVDPPVFFAALSEGSGNEIRVELAATNQTVTVGMNTNWQAGTVAEKAYTTGTRDAPSVAGAGDFERTNAFSYSVWTRVRGGKTGSLFSRMDDDTQQRGWDLYLQNGQPAFHLIHRWPENACKVIADDPLPDNVWTHICVTYDGSAKAAGVKIYVNGVLQKTSTEKDTLTETVRTAVPFRIGQRSSASPLSGAGVQDLRIYDRLLNPAEVTALSKAGFAWLATKTRTPEETQQLFALWLNEFDAPYRDLLAQRDGLKKEQADIRMRGSVAYVMQEQTNAPEAHVLSRGQYDQPLERVTPATPESLPPMTTNEPRNRLGFAKWLVAPENPLTARVTVNRYWQDLFGVGLVKTTGDFGVAGDQPSNQQLLDWLAVDFREHDWDVKRIIKLMVMSATYQQAATITPEKLEKDPENRLLSRGPRFRMDAEMIRDYALASSGLLVEKIGGPSVKPYQPQGLWGIGRPDSDTHTYVQDTGESLYRRSLYTFWKRQVPPASLQIFNAPSRETCTVRRNRTDTPLQALVTLNDPQFIEAARHLAQESLQSKTDVLNFMAQRLLARPLATAEKKILKSSAGDLLAYYRQEPKEAEKLLAVGDSKPDATLNIPALAAYTMVANEMMNLDEVLNN
jgi:hypothetical protein